MTKTAKEKFTNQPALFSSMVIVFFIWGFVTLLNDLLVPVLKQNFHLSYAQAMLVQFCFFVTYLIMSLPMASVVNRLHYKKGILLGLLVIAAGCLVFLPAQHLGVYALFLLALFVLATGVVILQVSANPLVTVLGPNQTSSARLTLAQGINSLGYVMAPFLVAGIATAANLPKIYITIAVIMLLVMLFISRLNFSKATITQRRTTKTDESLWDHKDFALAVMAIFLYVGAEVSVGSIIISYLGLPNIMHYSIAAATAYLTFYWGGAMIGRLLATPLLLAVSPRRLLAINALINILLIVAASLLAGRTAMWSLLCIGIFNSIMFPVIFSLGLSSLTSEGLKNKGSGWLIMAIVGGAVVPLLLGVLADHVGLQHSLLLLLLCYGFILYAAKNFRGATE